MLLSLGFNIDFIQTSQCRDVCGNETPAKTMAINPTKTQCDEVTLDEALRVLRVSEDLGTRSCMATEDDNRHMTSEHEEREYSRGLIPSGLQAIRAVKVREHFEVFIEQ